MRARNCIFWINNDCVCRRLFRYSLSFSLLAWHELYFLVMSIFIGNFFFQNFLLNIFFPKFFTQHFFSKIFYSTFFFQNFFSIFFFERFTLDAFSFAEPTRTLCICVVKNMICSERSKLDFHLVWCVKYSSSTHTAHITLDVKSPISSPCCIIYYLFFFCICDILLKYSNFFLDGI